MNQAKPRTKSVDALSDKKWQNSWIWRLTIDWSKPPKKLIKDKTAGYLVAGFILIMSIIAIGIIREVYIMAADKQCVDWQNKPLDQVPSKCLKAYIE